MAYVDQAALSINAEFVGRVRMAMLDAATDIHSEDGATTFHAQRCDLAINAVRDPERWTKSFVELVAADNPSLSAVSSDADIKTAVSSVWNILAGIVTT